MNAKDKVEPTMPQNRGLMILFSSLWRRWAALEQASIAVYVGFMIPALISAIALSVDLSQAYLVRERLSRAIDAAALAVAGSSFAGDAEAQEAAINKRVQDFIKANYPEEKIGAALNIKVEVNGDDITVSADAEYHTFFMNAIGINVMSVSASATVRKQVKGVEAILVLDNTGSMDYKPSGAPKKNIEALKDAANLFVTIMYNKAQSPEDVRIGLVPYANAVRIGRYGLGQLPDGSPYLDRDGDPVDPFVTLPAGVSYTTSATNATGWNGCVVEHKPQNYNSNATHVAGSYGQLWKVGNSWNGHGWNPAVGNNDPSPQDYLDDYEGPWDIYMFGKIIAQNSKCSDQGTGYSNSAANCSSCLGSSSRCNATYCYCKYTEPNNSCPRASVLPLTNDRDTLTAAINNMQAHGNTQGNAGMIWGSRLISPEPPFTEGAPWDSEYWQKAIIMMTDGDNTMDGTYSNYWVSAKNDINVNTSGGVDGLNQRFADTCDDLKSENKDVLIYTIVFRSQTAVSAANKAYYRDCATQPSMYYDAPDQESLQQAFENIARELSNLHLTK
jgi:Flp pilus assembly protein TadG